ncbi:hypothetical protein [Halosegnis sp.]|uniref:hypothetical protein n=1 Tax=Halosegnis sp. TaxID=2864959 RepID=UPI0035D3E1D6
MNGTTELAAIAAGRPPLRVDADLDVEVDGHPLSVTGEGDRLTVAVGSLGAATGLLRGVGGPDRVRSLATLATATGLTADVTVHGRTVARAGRRATPGAVGRRFGIELRPNGLVSAALAGLRAALT